MPICQICERKFPNRIYLDDKQISLHHRKNCLDCNPLGQRRIWRGKETCSARNGSLKRCLETREFVCVTCGKVRRQKTRNNECTSCRGKQQRNERKRQAIAKYGGACHLCGYNRCENALCFHHRDPKCKDFNVSANWGLSQKKIDRELQKCVLLCMNCHGEVHAGIRMI